MYYNYYNLRMVRSLLIDVHTIWKGTAAWKGGKNTSESINHANMVCKIISCNTKYYHWYVP